MAGAEETRSGGEEARSGGGCCLLGICCPPRRRLERLASAMAGAAGGGDQAAEYARAAAEWLLANFDLVPKGVGEAIVSGYRAAFRQELERGAEADTGVVS